MENASKALIMAGGVLIGVLIISLAVYLFVTFGQTSAEINSENSQKQLAQFNAKFTVYEGKENITIYDIITVAGYANENNEYYENSNLDYLIEVYWNNINVANKEGLNRLKNEMKNQQKSDSLNLTKYECKVTEYNQNGRVKKISFK